MDPSENAVNTKPVVGRAVIRAATVFLAIGLATGVSEVVVRAFRYRPWTPPQVTRNEPTMHEPDPVLGWRNKNGHYEVPPYQPGSSAIHITFLDDGRRPTALDPVVGADGDVVLVGDSFTQGWALNDRDTYAWKLQSRFPALRFRNYGTGGYSGYQSLLMLEQQLPRSTRPRLALYGFNDFHEDRNVAAGIWLQELNAFSRRGHVDLPFATYDHRHGLVRHPPDRYVSFPFRQSLALVPLVERGYMTIMTSRRSLQKRLVTEQVFLRMNEVSRAHGASLAVVLLSLDEEAKTHYAGVLKANGISAIDCVYEITPNMRVPGEGHPNAAMNSRWADCVAAALVNGHLSTLGAAATGPASAGTAR